MRLATITTKLVLVLALVPGCFDLRALQGRPVIDASSDVSIVDATVTMDVALDSYVDEDAGIQDSGLDAGLDSGIEVVDSGEVDAYVFDAGQDAPTTDACLPLTSTTSHVEEHCAAVGGVCPMGYECVVRTFPPPLGANYSCQIPCVHDCQCPGAYRCLSLAGSTISACAP